MLPTLNMTGDIVGYESLTQRFSKLETGDLVVAVSPRDPSKLICKRIIGVAGDKVCIDPVSVHRQYITVSGNQFLFPYSGEEPRAFSRELTFYFVFFCRCHLDITG